MGYIVDQTDLEDVFGTENVARWSNLEDTDGADTDAIDRAMAWAEAYVENRFRPCGIYALPFSPVTDPVLVNWCAVLAGLWLYGRRPNGGGDASQSWADKREEVEREMDLYIAGGRRLSCTRAGTKNASAPYVYKG